jgi:hypothetical protein
MKLSTNLDLIWNVSSFFFFYAWCAIYNCIIHVCHLSLCVFLSFLCVANLENKSSEVFLFLPFVFSFLCILIQIICKLFEDRWGNVNQSILYRTIYMKVIFMCVWDVIFYTCIYLQLHNTRLSSIFMCFSFFFVCGKFGKQIFRSLNFLFRNKQCISKKAFYLFIYFILFYFIYHIYKLVKGGFICKLFEDRWGIFLTNLPKFEFFIQKQAMYK